MGREQLRFKTVASGALPGSLLMTLMEGENDRGRESLGTVFFPKFSISTSTSSRGMDGGSSRWRLTPFAYYIIQICRGKNARVNFKGAKKSKSGKHSSSLPLSLSRSVPIFHCHPLSRFPPPPSLPPVSIRSLTDPHPVIRFRYHFPFSFDRSNEIFIRNLSGQLLSSIIIWLIKLYLIKRPCTCN